LSAFRRDIDSKAYALLAVTLGLLGMVGSFRVWERLLPNGQFLFIFTVVFYLATIAFGAYLVYPRPVFMPYSRAIQKFRDELSYDDLSESVALDIVDLIDAGVGIIENKSLLLEIMLCLVIIGSVILLASVIV
jgi:hypothetical protein